MRYTWCSIFLFLTGMLAGCSSKGPYADLQSSLSEFVAEKDATIGVAVIIDGKDTVEVNGHRPFPMMSVYKFPIALALAERYRERGRSLDDSIRILPSQLHPDTYSPMTEKILASDSILLCPLALPTGSLLAYMLQSSDNNASDIILDELAGTASVREYLRSIGMSDIQVMSSEDEMHIDNSLCYANCSTPIAMATLMDRFDRGFNDPLSMELKQMMETCSTGVGRLAKPLLQHGATIGHKTGTGFILPDGRLMAVNDAGYVHLPDGHSYSIAVFIENSGYDMDRTEALLAEISRIVLDRVLF